MSDKLKKKIRIRTRALIRQGKLVPKPCEVCGAKAVTAHHTNSGDPTSVRWLCPKCHFNIHHPLAPVSMYVPRGLVSNTIKQRTK